ncbi:Crp/Fnr family transcriptional regulator [Dyadobacter psychrotolerans]|uniref:Crp/Fnr family transcriptional regulator n=1 Tax=Dyadobacter psychrotolerans TaxID=2541721 RepID=A0A4R5DGH6_9BACT|nr:Crp/Fnr family transcriptional regulator [Dyadobacter psychrotolerans]TDE11011.1 Crp/Fnr family transcriptional regulator [Dyadobacter psychrotolerans]
MNYSKFENTVNGLRRYHQMCDASVNELLAHFTPQRLPKYHILIRPNLSNNYLYFIEHGCTRTYLIADGKEVTNWFSREGDITFSSNALYHRTAGFEYVQLLEDSLLYAMSIDTLNELYKNNIDIVNWSRIIHQEVLLKMQRLRLDQLSLTAKERYEKFIIENPGLINRVNLKFIASYLGMTQQHLSIIRAKH